MKITLLGGSGFVRTRLIDLLRQSGMELQNIDKQQSHFLPNLTVIGDVRDKEKLTELLKGTDLVVLLAAEHRDDVSPLSLYYDVNVTGIQNTLVAIDETVFAVENDAGKMAKKSDMYWIIRKGMRR